MTTEEAIYALRIEGINLEGKVPRVCKFLEALDIAISALRDQQQPNATPTGWISVKERLPVYFNCVLVWCPENACVYAAYRNVREEWHTFDDSVAGCSLQHDVTHWITLPETPEEGTT